MVQPLLNDYDGEEENHVVSSPRKNDDNPETCNSSSSSSSSNSSSPTRVCDFHTNDDSRQCTSPPQPAKTTKRDGGLNDDNIERLAPPRLSKQQEAVTAAMIGVPLSPTGAAGSRRFLPGRSFASKLPPLNEADAAIEADSVAAGPAGDSTMFDEEHEEEDIKRAIGGKNQEDPLEMTMRRPRPRRGTVETATTTTTTTLASPTELAANNTRSVRTSDVAIAAVITPVVASSSSPTQQQQQQQHVHPPLRDSRKRFSVRKTGFERIQELELQATEFVQCGQDTQAIKLYQKAISLTRNEIVRIKTQLQAEPQTKHHQAAVPSIIVRLHEDWCTVGLAISRIRLLLAILLERQEQYQEAIEYVQEAIMVYHKQAAFVSRPDFRGKDYLTAEELRRKSDDLQLLVNKIELAESTYSDRTKLHDDISQCQAKLALEQDASVRRKVFMHMEYLAKTVQKLEADILGDSHPRLATTFGFLASMALEQHDTDRALELLMQSLQINRSVLGLKHPETAHTFAQIARVYSSLDPADIEHSTEYYEKAIAIYEGPALAICKPFAAKARAEFGIVLSRAKDYDAALIHLQRAKLFYDALDASSVQIQSEIIKTYKSMGECHFHGKEFQKAIDSYTIALDTQRKASSQYEANNADSVQPSKESLAIDEESIADSLRRLGKAHCGAGQSRQAVKVYQEALVIHRDAAARSARSVKGRSSGELSEKQDQLAHTLFCIAEVYSVMGMYTDATKIFEESLQLRLFSDAHRSAGTKPSNMVHCAMCLAGIGNIHLLQEEYDEAKKVFRDALSFCEAHGIPSDHDIITLMIERIKETDEAKMQKNREPKSEAEVLEERAKLHVAQGDLETATALLTRIITLRRSEFKKLKSLKEDTTHVQLATAGTLKYFAHVLQQQGDLANAELAYKECLKLWRKSGVPGSSPHVQSTIEELRRLKSTSTRTTI